MNKDMKVEDWWNVCDRRKLKYSDRKSSSATSQSEILYVTS